MVLAFVPLIASVIVYSHAQQPSKACMDLSSCAAEKCLDKEKIRTRIASGTRVSVFKEIAERLDMVCIATKCTDQCTLCKQCHYALEQMTAFASGTEPGGLCPKLESCVTQCLSDDIEKILKCVASECNVHCYDGDCPSCFGLTKRIFSRVCRDTDMLNIPVLSSFTGTCPALFAELAQDYVNAHHKYAGKKVDSKKVEDKSNSTLDDGPLLTVPHTTTLKST